MTKNTKKKAKSSSKNTKVSKKIRKQIAQLNVMDDMFFHKLIEDRLVCQEILQIIMEDESLVVEEHHPQHSLKNLQGRSVILDAKCQGSNQTHYNFEVQKSDKDDHQRRVRFNGTLITSNETAVGSSFIDVPDVTVIYISNFDLFGENKTIYHVKRVLDETGTVVENGFSEIYTNTKVDDGTTIAELMQFFKNSTGYHKNFPHLSNRVKLFKETEEGVKLMSEIVEKIKAEGREEGREEGKRIGRREGKRIGQKEGTFQSAQILVSKGLVKSEKEACIILDADYRKFLNWKKKNA